MFKIAKRLRRTTDSAVGGRIIKRFPNALIENGRAPKGSSFESLKREAYKNARRSERQQLEYNREMFVEGPRLAHEYNRKVLRNKLIGGAAAAAMGALATGVGIGLYRHHENKQMEKKAADKIFFKPETPEEQMLGISAMRDHHDAFVSHHRGKVGKAALLGALSGGLGGGALSYIATKGHSGLPPLVRLGSAAAVAAPAAILGAGTAALVSHTRSHEHAEEFSKKHSLYDEMVKRLGPNFDQSRIRRFA